MPNEPDAVDQAIQNYLAKVYPGMTTLHIPLRSYGAYETLYRINTPDGRKNLHVSSEFMEDEDPLNIAPLFESRHLRYQLDQCADTEAILISTQEWLRGPIPNL